MNTTTASTTNQSWSYHGTAASLKREHCPKVNHFEKGYIYIASLSNGWVKVGRTAAPVERLASLRRGLRASGVTFGYLAVTYAHVNVVENEKAILDAFKDAERDGEYFVISFNAAAQAVEALELKLDRTDAEKNSCAMRMTAAYDSFNTGFGTREGSVK